MSIKNAVIFGASTKGAEAYEIFKDEFNILAFSDNVKNKWEAEFCGAPVIRPDDISKLDNVSVIVASMYWEEISSQLYAMGYEKIFIFFSSANEKSEIRYKLIPICDIASISSLYINEGEGALFASDFENIFLEEPPASEVNEEIIYRDKNVLFFAYYFPPIGSSGVQRSLKFVKYLKELGWNPIVISCGRHSNNLAPDESLLSEIPEDITVIRIDDRTTIVDQLTEKEMRQVVNLLYGAVDDYALMSGFIENIKENNGSQRNYLLYPQRSTMWVHDVLAAISQIIDFSKIHAVYVTSGPYLSSLIGYYLKSKYKKPWVMDFRDPWTQGIKFQRHYQTPKWVLDFEFALEKNMLKSADRIMAISHVCVNDYKNIFGIPAEKISLILNGYDETDFETVDTSASGPRDKLKIIYNGVLIEERSSPLSFISAVNEAIGGGLISKSDIEIEFVGERKPQTLEDKIKAADIHNIVALKPYAEHVESLRNLSRADILLVILLDNEGAEYMYPGKVFEYLRMHRRILALVPKGNVLELFITEAGAGVCIHPNDAEGIKEYLKEILAEIRSGKALNFNNASVEKYERKRGAEMLAGILDGFL